MFIPKSKVNPGDKDADIELYFKVLKLYGLKERRMEVEVSNSD